MEVTREMFEELKKSAFFKGVIVSDSMTPLIKVGDKIIVEVGCRDLRRFDVVVILVNGKLVCHFLWAMNRIVEPILFQTMNLKHAGKDFPVSFEDYLGKVVSHKLSRRDQFRIMLKKIFRS